MQHAAAYEAARLRVLDLLEAGPDAGVPATPGWTVRDVVGHLSGLAMAWLDGDIEGYATEPWTAAQVEARRKWSVEELASEWTQAAGRLGELLADPATSQIGDPLITAFGPLPRAAWPGVIVTDLAVHEHDIRGALDRPGARHSDAVLIAMRNHVGLLRFIGALRRLPNLVLAPTDHSRAYKVGKGTAEVSVAAPLFELFRATGGRRSLSQIEAMAWDGDAAPWLEHIVVPSYEIPGDPLVE